MYRRANTPVLYQAVGDTTPAPIPNPPDTSFSLTNFVHSDSFETGAAIALTYHGYRRTGSFLWALIYGLSGKWFPAVSVPIALAQGFGEKKPCP